jgi:ribonuclease III
MSNSPSLPNPLPSLPPIPADRSRVVYTHKSTTSTTTPDNYERLAYLGHAALELAVTRVLYDHPDHLDKGEIDRLRTIYITKDILARWGRAYHFDDRVNVGLPLLPLSTEHRNTFAADTFEAYLGAISLDSQDIITDFVSKLMIPGLEIVRDGMRQGPVDVQAMQRLNEMLVRLGIDLPDYEIDDSQNPGPRQFDARCVIRGNICGQANGRRKAEAKRRAAEIVVGKGETWLAAIEPLEG